ncbi:hypothetical protein VNO80_27078 [Phaseolus coccineus]|uniref:Uncharacterized protein n=1 Tax=Phaseolus coccineus TaxID=3886 RepID=A0AAN9QF18_PHACN
MLGSLEAICTCKRERGALEAVCTPTLKSRWGKKHQLYSGFTGIPLRCYHPVLGPLPTSGYLTGNWPTLGTNLSCSGCVVRVTQDLCQLVTLCCRGLITLRSDEDASVPSGDHHSDD